MGRIKQQPIREEIPQEPQNLFSLQSLHKSYVNLPAAITATLWAGVGYAAFRGLQAYNNEGFINDVVIVPIIEEIAYRGMLQPVIKKVQQVWNWYHKTTMNEESTRNRVLTSSVLFGLSHSGMVVLDNTWNAGRACGYLHEKTGSLFAPIAWHMVHNFISESALRPYVPKIATYPLLFYALEKKMFPIPDVVTTPIQSLASRIRQTVTEFFAR